jgi:hypothetical protein
MKNNHGICCARSKFSAYFSLSDLAGRKVAPTYTSNNTMNRLSLPSTMPTSCDLSFASGSTAYVNTNAPKLDVAQLDIYVTELAADQHQTEKRHSCLSLCDILYYMQLHMVATGPYRAGCHAGAYHRPPPDTATTVMAVLGQKLLLSLVWQSP